MQIEEILDTLIPEVKKLGRELKETSRVGLKLESKEEGDFATELDKKYEKQLYDFLKSNFPDYGFWGEELEELRNKQEYNWTVDAIDGTKYFYHDIPLWSMVVSLISESETLLGVIYEPATDKMYAAFKNGPAKVNGNRLNINEEIVPSATQISWDISASSAVLKNRYAEFQSKHAKIEQNFYRVRVLGNGSLACAWTATGFFGAYVNPYLEKEKLIDIQSGLLLIKQAGGKVQVEMIEKDVYSIIAGEEKTVDYIDELIG